MTRAETARRIRDHALAIVRRHGRHEPVGDLKFLTWRGAGFSVMHRTPFQRLPGRDEALKGAARKLGVPLEQARYILALEGIPAPEPLPYGLDLWHGKKVMNLEWAADDTLVIVSFRRGLWEKEFLKSTNLYAIKPYMYPIR